MTLNKHVHDAGVTKKNIVKNAFDIMMNKSLQPKGKVEGKTKSLKGMTTSKGTSFKSRVVGSSAKPISQKMENTTGPAGRPKLKMKEKMRPREKPNTRRGPLLIPMPDDDEDEEENESTFPALVDNAIDPVIEATKSRCLSEPFIEKVSIHSEAIGVPMQVDACETATGDDSTALEVLEKEDMQPMNNHHEVANSIPNATNASENVLSLPLNGSPPAMKSHVDHPDNEENKTDEASELKQLSLPKPGSQKPSLSKKRQPSSIVPVGRVTRSSSKQPDPNIVSSKPGK